MTAQLKARSHIHAIPQSFSRAAVIALVAGGACHFEHIRLNQRDSITIRTEQPADPGDDGVVRFFAIGDAGVRDGGAGLGVSTEAVGRLTAAVCNARGGCDFGVFLGDNVYETGINVGDPLTTQFFVRFVGLYERATNGGLYFVLGNHDYHPYFPSSTRARHELQLIESLRARGVRGASHFFNFRSGNVELFAWDTNYIVRQCDAMPGSAASCRMDGAGQLSALSRSDARWRVWLGHHPYRSNGEHGNAGEYRDAGFALWPGRGLQWLLEAYVVGQADLLLSGHDHNLQAFAGPSLGGSAAVVSGAGAKSTPLRPLAERQPAEFGLDRVFGLALIEASDSCISVSFYTVPEKQPFSAATWPAFSMSKLSGGIWTPGGCSEEAGTTVPGRSDLSTAGDALGSSPTVPDKPNL